MLNFRPGSASDCDAIVALFDANIAWLVERGRSAQWGSEPFSISPEKVEFVRGLLSSGTITTVEADDQIVGASLLTDHPMHYVPTIDHPERYLKLLIASPNHRGEGIGHQLIERARASTVAEGVDLLRVDCWSGGDRKLVSYYTSQGFVPTEVIEVRPDTFVQVFEWRASMQQN